MRAGSDLPVAELVRAITGAAPAPPGAGKDLDTIVLKALARDPEARYQSASELAKDVEHHLRGEPIGAPRQHALPPVPALARHKLALAVVLLVAAALLASTVISLAFWRRSQRDAETARAEARRADAVNDFLQDLLFAATPQGARGRTLSLRDVLDESAARLSIELDQAPDIASALRAAIGKSYQSLGLFAQALPQLKAALEMRRRDLGDRHPLVAASLRELGGLWLEYGRLNEADAAFNEAIAILRAQSERKLELARTLTDAAGVPDARGDNDRATALVQEAILLYRGERYDGPRIATSLQRLGDLLAGRDDRAHAEQRYREALQIWEQQEPRERLGLAACLRGLATSLGEQGRHDESLARWRQATELLRKLLGPDALVVWDGEIASALAESRALGEHRAAAS
ncbi:MAG: tetratricopeptide repeat protein [Planctomycetota bacterium]